MMAGRDDIPDGVPHSGSRRRRSLKPEERQLWEHVTRSIVELHPLPKRRAATSVAIDQEPLKPEAELPAVKPTKASTPPSVKAVVPAKPAPPPLAPLEPKARRRLSRGAEVDARLDLHGMTQAAAHSRLHGFLRGAQASGHSLVLVITGKGDGTGLFGSEGRGVLRRMVPQWLAAPDMRAIVIGFETAARGHGGEGALYVRVRRLRVNGP